MKIIKANGVTQIYDEKRIIAAIQKAANQTGKPLSEDEINNILSEVSNLIGHYGNLDIDVDVDIIHELVSRALSRVRVDVATEYRDYRQYKRKQNAEIAKLNDLLSTLPEPTNIQQTQDLICAQLELLQTKHPSECGLLLLSRYLSNVIRSENKEILAYLKTSAGISFVTSKF